MQQYQVIFYKADFYLKQYPFKINKLTEFHQRTHSHDYVQIWFVKNGECSNWIGDNEYKLKKGDIVVLPTAVSHRLESYDCQNLVMISCDFLNSLMCCDTEKTRLNRFFLEMSNLLPIFRLRGVLMKQADELFERMALEYSQKHSGFELAIHSDILRLLCILLRETDRNENSRRNNLAYIHRESIMKAIGYIDMNYRKKITLAEVCKITLMSPTYFAYIFKEVTGRTFTEYINYLRIQNAVELLSNPGLTICEISQNIGLQDPAYFSRLFKKHMGVSPEKYRNVNFNI